jgi:hypothetical protein
MDTAKALLDLSVDLERESSLPKAANIQQTSATENLMVEENVLPDSQLISEPSKEQDVQTDITLEHLKLYSTESLSSATEIKTYIFFCRLKAHVCPSLLHMNSLSSHWSE